MFINRNAELEVLTQHLVSDRSELLIVYGRRRIGKTEVLTHFAKGRQHLYFTADLTSEREQLRQFSEKIYRTTGASFLRGESFPSWESLLSYLFESEEGKSCGLVIIDEFPYLCYANPALPSILQKVWDRSFKAFPLKLILCGSYISFMEEEVLGYRSPLYGRRTGQILVEPMDFFDAWGFLPEYSFGDMMATYAIVGGIPAYLIEFKDTLPVLQNVTERLLEKSSFLYDEARFLLMEELREPRNYFAILRSVAFGKTQMNEIVQDSGLDRGLVAKYLDVLRELRLVERLVPVTESIPHKSRKGIYRLTDHFLRCWFRFVFPNRSYLEEGNIEDVMKGKIEPQLNQFIGPVFEEVSRQLLKRLNRKGMLPIKLLKIGSWWDRREEIDIVGCDETNNDIFGECKWTEKPVGIEVLNDLRRKAEYVAKATTVNNRYYALFSKKGFTTEVEREAKKGDLLLFQEKGFMV
jgi:AAA+ ATPase superfamily predicted ATPase